MRFGISALVGLAMLVGCSKFDRQVREILGTRDSSGRVQPSALPLGPVTAAYAEDPNAPSIPSGSSSNPSISGDGRHIAFSSTSVDLGPTDSNIAI